MQKFITEYLISGPYSVEKNEMEMVADHSELPAENMNQLDYETYLRTILPDYPMEKPNSSIRLGENSELGLPWCYHYNYGNWFVDYSQGYAMLNRVEMLAVTGLVSKTTKKVNITLWSYGAIGLWCNNAFVGGINKAVYKPMSKQELVLDLKEGYNEIIIRFQNLGVRDTRNIFGIELTGECEGVQVRLSDEYGDLSEFNCTKEWLDTLILNEECLMNALPAPSGTSVSYGGYEYDYAKAKQPKEHTDISGMKNVELQPNNPNVIVTCCVKDTKLVRRFEKLTDMNPIFGNSKDFEENKLELLNKIAEVESLNRGNKFGFAISNILARRAINKVWEKDETLLYETLNQIEKRYDCTDFLIAGLIRYMKSYPLDSRFEARAKEVLIDYRYWMTHNGVDAMCFWSENHSLLFYSAAMFCGEMYPNANFKRTDMNGRQLSEFGKKHVLEWLEDVEKEGFEEFLASTYVSITFMTLLNLVDFADEEISKRASGIADYLVTMLAKHTFDGSIFGPMGRVYGDVLYPFKQGAQALLNLINPQVPYDYSEGWMAAYATTKYRFPDHLVDLMNKNIKETYTTGNTCIHLNKQKNYVLTSVESPRADTSYERWENVTLMENSNQETHEYTKSLNERFHGTTFFEPGVYGYQQHLWYGALDNQTPVFVTHPGGTSASCATRPGYWYGNGVFPAIKQVENKIGSIYSIPDSHPIHFTHAFWPKVRMDQTVQSDGWLFGRKSDGFIALWCSDVMEEHQDQLFACEYRVYSSNSAYLCICSDTSEDESFDIFMEKCKLQRPHYDKEQKKLTTKEFELTYKASYDLTQYV
jgi:hypothetical protein